MSDECNCGKAWHHHEKYLRSLDATVTITVPLKAWDNLLDGVKAMGERSPTSRAEWMARDFVKAALNAERERP